jgi:hypothetical protein
MTDISMCPSWQCPSRSTCRRNEASGTQPSHWQSWTNFDTHRGVAERCESFMPVNGSHSRKAPTHA